MGMEGIVNGNEDGGICRSGRVRGRQRTLGEAQAVRVRVFTKFDKVLSA